ncbi:MAG: DUF1993 domain-containing protein [Patescibacteria group bacterium]
MTNPYLLSIQTAVKTMKSLINILNKTKQHINTENISEEQILQSRLAPDMFPLTKQIQIVSDNAKGMAARLGGLEIPSYKDSESSIDQLIERLNKTINFVESVPKENFNEAETRQITIQPIPGKYMSAQDYIKGYGLPNFFFHTVTTYAILRNQGVSIGKRDYLNMEDINLFDLE